MSVLVFVVFSGPGTVNHSTMVGTPILLSELLLNECTLAGIETLFSILISPCR